ncbi:MAG: TIGR03809 family protein [Alphaproteobacteria bacterium]|nr:TIGR03809 family protein [Alphaproteobacteria bacterium]
MADDGANGTGVAARWCALAERRLNHLIGMFETGRWRWYSRSEAAFLEDIKEAKDAVEMWRALAATLPPPVSLGREVLGRSQKLSWREYLQGERRAGAPGSENAGQAEPPARARKGTEGSSGSGKQTRENAKSSRYPFLKTKI